MASRVSYILLQAYLLALVDVLLVVLYTAYCLKFDFVVLPKLKLLQSLTEHTFRRNIEPLTSVGCKPPSFAHVYDLDVFCAPAINISV